MTSKDARAGLKPAGDQHQRLSGSQVDLRWTQLFDCLDKPVVPTRSGCRAAGLQMRPTGGSLRATLALALRPSRAKPVRKPTQRDPYGDPRRRAVLS